MFPKYKGIKNKRNVKTFRLFFDYCYLPLVSLELTSCDVYINKVVLVDVFIGVEEL